MEEIGRKLRERRLERGLDLDRVEAGTRIRVKYLKALEDGRFEVLPGPAYARAFLRDYAEELGLDGQALVDELNSRVGPPEEVVLAPVRSAAVLESPWVAGRRALGWIAVAGIAVAAAVLVLLALTASSGGRPNNASRPPGTRSHRTTPPGSTSRAASTTAHAHAAAATLALSAIGPCWVEVRAAGETGPLLYIGMLEAGQVHRYHRKALWVRVGAPWNLVVLSAGHRLAMPLSAAGNVLVTPAAVTAA